MTWRLRPTGLPCCLGISERAFGLRSLPATFAGGSRGRHEAELVPRDKVLAQINALFAGDGLSDGDQVSIVETVMRKTLENDDLRVHDVASIPELVGAMRPTPRNVRYSDLRRVCEHYFGAPRTTGGSHAVFRTPWPGDPRVNIQNDKGTAKAYQVRQVLAAIERLEAR